jgi:hypothetical protein
MKKDPRVAAILRETARRKCLNGSGSAHLGPLTVKFISETSRFAWYFDNELISKREAVAWLTAPAEEGEDLNLKNEKF